MKRHYIIPIFVPHKGCPHDCVFCNQKRITGQIEDVSQDFGENEIYKYLDTIPREDRFVEVSFFGGSFTGLPADEQINLLKPAKAALDKGMVDAIRLSTRPDYIDDDILAMLRKNGVSIIELGVQSMADNVLKMSNRGHSASDVHYASSLIKSYGFTLGLQMMIGLPGDNEMEDMKTADEFVRIAPSMVRIYPTLVIKDTYLEDLYYKGQYTPLDLDHAVEICSKLYLKFEKAGITVIRIGLQPTDRINYGGDIVSGPFHPAFRELVESKILNNMILYLHEKQDSKVMEICINERSLSKVYAGGKKYFKAMLDSIRPSGVIVSINNSIPIGSIAMFGKEKRLILSIKDYSLNI